MTEVAILLDTCEVDELNALLDRLAELPVDLIDLPLQLALRSLDDVGERLLRLEAMPASDAGDVVVRLRPSRHLELLVAALRASPALTGPAVPDPGEATE